MAISNLGAGGTYDKSTGTYTDKSGNSYSTLQSNVPFAKVVTPITPAPTPAPTTETKKKHHGGSSYVDTKSGIGYEVDETGTKKQIDPYQASQETEGGKKLHSQLQQLPEENKKYEEIINTETKNYQEKRLSYYQDLVNKKKLSSKEANIKLKEDLEIFYYKLVDSENQRRQQVYKNVIDANAVTYIGDFQGIADQTVFTPPEKTTGQKIVDVLKALPLSITRYSKQTFSESSVKNLAEQRDTSVLSGLLWGSGKTFNTVPLKKTYSIVSEERNLNYKAEQEKKLMESYGEFIETVPEELKYNVQKGSFDILKSKGVEIKEENVVNVNKEGDITTETVYTLSGKEFDRKISESIYRMEEAKTTFKNPSLKALDITMAGAGIFSKNLAENLALWESIKLGVQGGKLLYEGIGGGGYIIEGVKAGKGIRGVLTLSKEVPYAVAEGVEQGGFVTVKLAEGSVKVPRTFNTFKNIGAGLLVGFAGYETVLKYKEYKQMSELAGKDVFWLETAGALAGFEASTGVVENVVRKGGSRLFAEGKILEQADLSMEGFVSKYGERVYMERYAGFKLSKPKTWLKSAKITYSVDQRTGEIFAERIGTPKGSFVKKLTKKLPDELVAYYSYGGDVAIYGKGGELKRIVKADPFPYDDPKTHYDWFVNRNIKEFGLPAKSELPINVKNKGFGYSATDVEWSGNKFDPMEILYGKNKILKTQGAIQYVSGKGVSGGFLRVFSRGTYENVAGKTPTSPIIYADYFDKVKLNRAIKEIKGVDINTARELKAYIYSKKVNLGELNIGGAKQEVEGTVEFSEKIPVRRKFAIKLEGWKIPIEEQIFAKKSDLSAKELKAIIKEVGKVEEITTPQYSILPSKTKRKPYISSVGRSQKSSSVSRVISQINRDVSSSLVSPYSFLSSRIRPSRSINSIISSYSGISRPSSSVSSSYSSSSTTSRPPSRPYGSFSLLPPKLSGKLTKKMKKKKGDYWLLGSLPDFTARSVGLGSPEINIKDIEKELTTIKTGGEVRRGVKLKW